MRLIEPYETGLKYNYCMYTKAKDELTLKYFIAVASRLYLCITLQKKGSDKLKKYWSVNIVLQAVSTIVF